MGAPQYRILRTQLPSRIYEEPCPTAGEMLTPKILRQR